MIGTFRLSIQHQSSHYPTQVDRLTQRQRRYHFKSNIPQQREFSTQQGADMGVLVDVLATPTAIRIPGAIQGVGGFLLQLTHRLNRKARQPA